MSPWFIWSIAGLFYLYEVVLRVSPGVMTHELMRHFSVNSTSLGFLTSAYYYSYVFLQIPGGLIVDKLGPRIVITVSAFISIMGAFLFSISNDLWLAGFARFLIGAGAACAFIGCLKIINLWFCSEKFSRICALTNMMGTLGGLFAGYPLAKLVHFYGWSNTSFYTGVVGIFIVFLSWFVIRDRQVSNLISENKSDFFKDLKNVLCNKNIWFISIFSGFMYVPITGFAELWGVPFIVRTYNVDTEIASSINVLLFLGSAFGSIAYAYFTDYFRSYLKAMKLSALLTACIFLLITFSNFLPFYIFVVLLLLAGFAMGGQVLSFSYINNLSCCENLGISLGFCNAITMLSGIIFQPLLGAVLDIIWYIGDRRMEYDTPIYSADAYSFSILIIPIFLLFAYFLISYSKEVYKLKAK